SNLVVQAQPRPETQAQANAATPSLNFAMQAMNDVVTNESSQTLSLRPTVGEAGTNLAPTRVLFPVA
ncbi:MAG TPA: hypothetical protein PLA94_11510, partial [Myxococcota bacterium]|nr:hypothetical protein [Myxococcota bacterium]